MAEETDFSASAVAFRIKFLLACFVMGKLDLQGKHNIMNNAKTLHLSITQYAWNAVCLNPYCIDKNHKTLFYQKICKFYNKYTHEIE